MKAEQTKTQLFQWLGFRSRSAPAPQMPSLGAVEGGVSQGVYYFFEIPCAVHAY
jgi:hypothetical protein